MNDFKEYYPELFNPELFNRHTIDIVHILSVKNVAEGKKPADISDRNQARIVLRRISELLDAGVTVRFIDEINTFTPPDGFDVASDSLILGGAFSGQCLKAYQETLDKRGVAYTTHPLLTVRA